MSNWADSARCRRFPDLGWLDDRPAPDQRRRMRIVCASCPVAAECLDEAIRTEPTTHTTGFHATFRAGLTATQRMQLTARVRRQPADERLRHGQPARYLTGCRCDECASAHTNATAAHGTTDRYRGGCRCDECVAAWAVHKTTLTGAAAMRANATPAHGTNAAYRRGCRCPVCGDAQAARYRRKNLLRNQRKQAG